MVLDEYPEILVNLNFVRDNLSKTVPHPIILFLPEYALTRLARYAPDFWAWGRKVFCFKSDKFYLNRTTDSNYFLNDSIRNLESSEKKERINLLLRLSSERNTYKNEHLPNLINIYNELGVAFRSLGDYQQAIYYDK